MPPNGLAVSSSVEEALVSGGAQTMTEGVKAIPHREASNQRGSECE
jgi:hypothetical protein